MNGWPRRRASARDAARHGRQVWRSRLVRYVHAGVGANAWQDADARGLPGCGLPLPGRVVRSELRFRSNDPPHRSPMLLITPVQERYAASYRECLDVVARERRYLAQFEALALERIEGFVKDSVANDAIQFFALDGERVVGWADIFPNWAHAISHCGSLGMGVHPAYRGHGLGGRRLPAGCPPLSVCQASLHEVHGASGRHGLNASRARGASRRAGCRGMRRSPPARRTAPRRCLAASWPPSAGRLRSPGVLRARPPAASTHPESSGCTAASA